MTGERFALMILGAVASLALACGLVALLERVAPSIALGAVILGALIGLGATRR